MEAQSQIVAVYGNLDRGASAPAYARTIATRLVVFSCVRCAQEQQEWRYPGPTPKYCPSCRIQATEEREARRVQRQRERRQKDRLSRIL